MKPSLYNPILIASIIPKVIATPAFAQVRSVTNIQILETETGLEVVLETLGDEPLETFIIQEGNSAIANIPNAQLAIPGGEFRQLNPVAGITEITAVNIGTDSVQIRITGETGLPQAEVIPSAEGLVLNVMTAMDNIDDVELIELVVTATRTQEDPLNIPRSVTTIDRQQIETQAATSNNVSDIISRLVPGFGPPNLSNRANAQTLRGRNFSVLIDGIPQRSNRSPNVQLEYIDPDSIERIEVVSGPTAIYGAEATGGVINIITRKPTEEQFRSTVSFGLNNIAIGDLPGDSIGYDLGYGISGQEGIVDYRLSFDYGTTGNFYDAAGDLIPTDNRTLDNTETIGVLGQVGIDIDDQQRLEFNLIYNRDNRDIEVLPVTNPDPNGKTLANRQTIQFEGEATQPEIRSLSTYLSYSHDNLFLDSAVGFNLYYRDSFQSGIPGDGRNDGFFDAIVLSGAEEEAFGGQLQIETPLSESADLLWGVDFEWQHNGASVTKEADPTVFDNQGIFRAVNQYSNLAPAYDLNSLGLFGQLQWDVTPEFILSGGVRYDRFGFSVDRYVTFYDDDFDRFFDPGFNTAEATIAGGERTFDSTVFNVGTVYKLTPEFSLFANFSQGFSVPRFLNFLGFPPTPSSFTIGGSIDDLQPQKVNQYEIGLRGRWDTVQAGLAAFYNSSDLGARLVENDRGILTLQRAPERIYGIEASVNWQPTQTWQF
ncbi:MAG: TonB-dependent receptor domain-containing protein, partial [Spirulinaceae cyanobacterium]